MDVKLQVYLSAVDKRACERDVRGGQTLLPGAKRRRLLTAAPQITRQQPQSINT